MKLIMLSRLLIFALLTLLLAGCRSEKQKKPIHILFRFDDFSEKSNTELEKKIIGLFEKHNISLTLAVIPFVLKSDFYNTAIGEELPLSMAKIEMLTNALSHGIVEIALHGYSHQSVRQNVYSEFSGLPEKEQKERIVKGKAYLEEITGLPIVTFVPPWNSYDLNTIHILEAEGFRNLSASTVSVVDKKSTLRFIPYTTTPDKFIQAVKHASESYEEYPLVVVMIHETDFFEIDANQGIITYHDFEKSLEWLKQQENILTSSFAGFYYENSDFSAHRLEINSKIMNLRNKMLPFTRPRLKGYYYSEPDLISAKIHLLIYIVIVLSTVVILSYFLSSYIRKIIYRIRNFILVAFVGLIIAEGLFINFYPKVGYKIILILLIMNGISIGVLIFRMLHSGKKGEDVSV